MGLVMNKSAAMINQDYLANESEMLERFLLTLSDYHANTIQHRARALVTSIRQNKSRHSMVEAFLNEYQLNSEEGLVLMGLAEALLRIPDKPTQDLFLQEKLTEANWHKHLLHSNSILVNFASQALDLSAKVENSVDLFADNQQRIVSRLISQLGLPLIRTAIQQAMQQLAYQFVIAEDIDKAISQSHAQPKYLYSFDMLGEAALTAADAERYFDAYALAIKHIANHAKQQNPYLNPGISIKLSALYPRYEFLKHKQAVEQIRVKLLYLIKKARAANIPVTIDAEESERLQMSLDIFSGLIKDDSICGWPGLGIAVQAYQKRAFSTLQWLIELSQSLQSKIAVRLVKGAYWDSEIKRAQINGLSDYPVFSHKQATDLSYLACSQLILQHPEQIYPQFATHNAHTVAAIQEMAKNHPGYEFQRLHGMGEQLYNQVLQQTEQKIGCRIYAPVGCYQDLLPYLVRRLLENGANTSFIHQLENPDIPIQDLLADPVVGITKQDRQRQSICLPIDLYGENRQNSAGVNLADPEILAHVQQQLESYKSRHWQAAPLLNGIAVSAIKHPIHNPADALHNLGSVIHSNQETINQAIDFAEIAYKKWRLSRLQHRAEYLLKTAELIEHNRDELLALCVYEAGKTIEDALAEIRETVDFCRYYAQIAILQQAQPQSMPGPTGESNLLYQYGRGIFVCISPWNFPLAIFIGQISAALVTGNCVIAMPAPQTSLCAMRCVQLLFEAGIPAEVLQFLPGEGQQVGQQLLSDPRIAGVAFTGSLATARLINQRLAQLPAIIPLIAETGGQNVMIADTSAYTEQLVQDTVQSAFNSTGQRCSALRVLYVPYETADSMIEKLIGMMHQLIIDKPENYACDIGPLISQQAADQLHKHVNSMRKQAKLLFQMQIPQQLNSRCFFPPTLIELNSLSQLKQENFGPILHLIRYHPDQLNQVIEQINNSGFGLTLGIHSRIDHTINSITQHCQVGNVYINRNMISAVVGTQPFGGMGLSGTGPKAGGPHYLQRFCNEQTVTTNTAAIGGNARLLAEKLL